MIPNGVDLKRFQCSRSRRVARSCLLVRFVIFRMLSRSNGSSKEFGRSCQSRNPDVEFVTIAGPNPEIYCQIES